MMTFKTPTFTIWGNEKLYEAFKKALDKEFKEHIKQLDKKK